MVCIGIECPEIGTRAISFTDYATQVGTLERDNSSHASYAKSTPTSRAPEAAFVYCNGIVSLLPQYLSNLA